MALKVGVVGMNGIGNNHANCHAQMEKKTLTMTPFFDITEKTIPLRQDKKTKI